MASSTPRFLVTGCTGFIGSHLCSYLSQSFPLVGISSSTTRSSFSYDIVSLSDFISGSLDNFLFDFLPTHVIHCAALAHQAYPTSPSDLQLLYRTNVELPLRVAEVSSQFNIERFIFLSSIGVHGSHTASNNYFNEQSPFSPANPYSVSKLDAEVKLRLFFKSKSTLSIIRPTLVYGPNMPGNFRNLTDLIDLGLPLPFGSIANQKSFLSIFNLTRAIELISLHPSAYGEDYVIADQELTSTPELIRFISEVRHRPSRLLPVPAGILTFFKRFPFVGTKVSQLCDDLVVDSSKLRFQLGWRQPFSQSFSMKKSFSVF